MKFLGGFITGVIATILVLTVIYVANNSKETLSSNDTLVGLRMLPEKGECITKSEITIFQTIKPNMALAEFGKYPNSKTFVLLVNYEGETYYDNKKITIPANKCARQIGTYQFETKSGILKTVPVVVVE